MPGSASSCVVGYYGKTVSYRAIQGFLAVGRHNQPKSGYNQPAEDHQDFHIGVTGLHSLV